MSKWYAYLVIGTSIEIRLESRNTVLRTHLFFLSSESFRSNGLWKFSNFMKSFRLKLHKLIRFQSEYTTRFNNCTSNFRETCSVFNEKLRWPSEPHNKCVIIIRVIIQIFDYYYYFFYSLLILSITIIRFELSTPG